MKDPRDSLVALGLNFTDERSCKHLSDTFMLHGPWCGQLCGSPCHVLRESIG